MNIFTAFKIQLALCTITSCCLAQDAPRPIPLTRPEMKKMLEEVKYRIPRIPLPAISESERQALGERANDYESRLRYLFLDRDTPQFGSGRRSSTGSTLSRTSPQPTDPHMTLDNGFKVELFWIVSRTNNCQYCLGHQETKLLGAGRREDQIAALDGDWTEFTPAQQAAFAFARKLTHTPHQLSDADISRLGVYFTDMQILEMTISMAWNNAINRWKEGVGVPQRLEEGGYSRVADAEKVNLVKELGANMTSGSYLTPTAVKYQTNVTKVAPTEIAEVDPAAWKNFSELENHLQECKSRIPRLPLATEQTTRELMPSVATDQPIPNWMRLLANFPEEGVRRASMMTAAENSSEMSELLKAQISWITARNDGAWYALGVAMRRLRALGQTNAQIEVLDTDWSGLPSEDQALFRIAKNLAASPVVLTDAQVAKAVELAGPAKVVQTINFVTQLAAFNRVTEAAGLPLDD